MSEPLQFDRADDEVPVAVAGSNVQSCAGCSNAIVDRYFTVKGQINCPTCHDRVIAAVNQSFARGSFAKALLHGSLGAIAGAAITYAIYKATDGWYFGAIVGYFVGDRVAKGANKKGGRGYQALAIALTYLGLSLLALPEISEYWNSSHSVLNRIKITIEALLIAPVFISFKSFMMAAINGLALWEAWRLNRTPTLAISGPHVVNAAVPPIVAEPPSHVG